MEEQQGFIVIAPNGCKDYLTPNKEYEAFNIEHNSDGMTAFNVICDDGDEIYTCLKNSAHLNFKDWIIKNQDQL